MEEDVSQDKKIKTEECYILKNGNKISRPVTEYDEKGNKIKIGVDHYEYDENGNVTKLSVYDSSGTTVEHSIEYAYDTVGNLIKEKDSKRDYWEEWEYNSDNQKIKCITHRMSDDSISLIEEYDDLGEMVDGVYYYSDGTEAPLVVNEYDEKGRKIKASIYDVVDPKHYKGCKEYQYNDAD